MTAEEMRAVRATLRIAYPGVRLVSDRAARRHAAALASGELAAPLPDGDGRTLIVDPRDLVPVDVPAPDALRLYWRELTRARGIELAKPEAIKVADWLRAAGPEVLPELRAVLADDGILQPDAPEPSVVARAAGILAELAAFDPEAVAIVFPTLARFDWGELDVARRVLAEHSDLRPLGAAGGPATPISPTREPFEPRAGLARSDSARKLSNFARAAILAAATPGGAVLARKALRDGLMARLARALRLAAPDRWRWEAALGPVAVAAGGRLWGPAGRVLFDLQSLAADAAPVTRRLRRVAPLEVPVPVTVSRLRTLHAARAHLHAAQFVEPRAGHELDELIEAAATREAAILAATAGPVLDQSLREAGLGPANEAEEVAHAYTVAKLARKLGEWGFLRIGDLRDALAQGQVKMPDLKGVGEWLRGDALLRADVLLGKRLPGAYWPGEIYLRWIHRATSVAFGTPWGRLLWRYLLLPISAAFLGVEFAGYLRLELGHVFGWFLRVFGVVAAHKPGPPREPHGGLAMPPDKLLLIAGVALLISLLVNSGRARAAAARAGRGCLSVLTAGPRWLWESPPVVALRRSRAVTAFASPTVAALLMLVTLAASGASAPARWWAVAATFVLIAAGVRTGRGRRMEVRFWQSVADAWHAVTANLLPGIVSFVLDVFRRAGELGERGLYAVDEFLRFREGQSALVAVGKGVARTLWRPFAYVTRFAFTLLIEPQVNPIKHFPVVTVSHKMLLPLVGVLSEAAGISLDTAFIVIACIPGIFGFVVWELRANWRLYDATRAPFLEPAILGHHGETARRYLRPGFHSGTVPKLYRPWRRAWARARLENRPTPATPYPERLAEIAATVRHWADAELVARLNRTAAWHPDPLSLASVSVGVRSFRLLLHRAKEAHDPVRIVLWLRAENVVMAVRCPDWLAGQRREAFDRAVEGLAAAAGVPGARVAWSDWVTFWEEAKYSRGFQPGRFSVAPLGL